MIQRCCVCGVIRGGLVMHWPMPDLMTPWPEPDLCPQCIGKREESDEYKDIAALVKEAKKRSEKP